MNTKAFVLSKEDYDKKLAEAANIFVDKNTKQPLPYVEVGKKLYTTMGCAQCHSINGSRRTGPTWKGLYKRDVEFSKSNVPGYTLKESDDDKKWDDYLRESILHPEAKIVQGFQNVMPPQESALSGSPYKEKKLAAIVEYIKSLGDPKYYKPMKTPELQSSEKPQAGDSAKPPAETSRKRMIPRPIAVGETGREEGGRKMIAKSREPDNYLTHSRGISSWIFTLDHKRIGVMYLLSVIVAMFLGGLFAMLIRTQLLDPAGLLFHKTEILNGLRWSTSRTTRSSRSTARS